MAILNYIKYNGEEPTDAEMVADERYSDVWGEPYDEQSELRFTFIYNQHKDKLYISAIFSEDAFFVGGKGNSFVPFIELQSRLREYEEGEEFTHHLTENPHWSPAYML